MLCAACNSKTSMPGDRYPADYVAIDALPYNIQVNSKAVWSLKDSFPEFRTITLAYPEYQAEGILTVVMVDSARLIPAMSRYLTLMEMRADTICDIYDTTNPAGIRTWVFMHPYGKEQLQWMATDSSSMYVAGNIHFAAATDSTVDITPALKNIREDIVYMIDNLTTEK